MVINYREAGFRSSLRCSQGGWVRGARWCSDEVVQFPWSPSPVAGLGIGCREAGLGGKERSNSQASYVGPWLDAGADANVEPRGAAPTSPEARALANPEPLPRSLALTVWGLFPPELAHSGDCA